MKRVNAKDIFIADINIPYCCECPYCKEIINGDTEDKGLSIPITPFQVECPFCEEVFIVDLKINLIK